MEEIGPILTDISEITVETLTHLETEVALKRPGFSGGSYL